MCLILFAMDPCDDLALVVAANRDEFYGRPALPAHFWTEHPDLFAGRDEEMGGTWLGVTRQGRFAAVTNFREESPGAAPSRPGGPRSRGELPAMFLASNGSASDYMAGVARRRDEYRGFNLLLFDGQSFGYYSNQSGEPQILAPGSYGVSNRALDCDWPKVVDGKNSIHRIARGGLDKSGDRLVSSLFDLLTDEGDGREFSNSFIRSDGYGTRAATVVIVEKSGAIYFEERSFKSGGVPAGRRKQEISSACS